MAYLISEDGLDIDAQEIVDLSGFGQTPSLLPLTRAVASATREAVRTVQSWINMRAFGPSSGRTPITLDGVWGPQTEWGFGLAGGVGALVATAMPGGSMAGGARWRLTPEVVTSALRMRSAYLARRGR